MIEDIQAFELDNVNTMTRTEFVAAFGTIFEHAPWVAESAWAARPFVNVDALHMAMMDVVRRSPPRTQIAFLCGHPELAGIEAQAGTMTNESVGEQASAGLDALSLNEIDDLRQLNSRYREKHSFPFIIAARRYQKAEIFSLLRIRIVRSGATELIEALAQISAITRLRIEERICV